MRKQCTEEVEVIVMKMIKDGRMSWEALWMLLANAVILGVSIYMGDDVLSIIASLTGVICVILCGLGKVSNYFWGTINVILYAYVAWKAKYYGDVMLNLIYYLPTNIIGWVMWSKNVNSETKEVYKKRLTVKWDIIVVIASIIGIFGYSYVLKLLGGNLPLVDSMSTVLSIVAQILMINRYAEQWIIWILVDVVSVIMWFVALFGEGQSVAVLLMWTVYLANAVIMYIKWRKDTKVE